MNESAQPVDAHNATEPDLWGEHSGDFLRLQVLWSQRTHFSLVFAAVDQPTYRDVLIKRLPGQRLDVSPSDSPMDWLARLQDAWAQGVTRVHTVFAEPPTDAWWQRTNVLRERLAEAFPALLLLWLSDRAIDAAAHQAPDLWNWRETVLTFTQPPTWSAPALLTTRFTKVSDTDAQAVKQRLEDIQRYLQQGDADALSSAHLNLEAAQIHYRLGQWPESEAAARAAEQTFLHAGNTHMALLAKGQIADILQARGELDEALRIRKDEELPVLERLGDVRSVLVARANLALLYWLKNRVLHADEARRLLALALIDAQRLRLPEAGQILALQADMGFLPQPPAA